jgi:hypothetical protein
MKWNLITDPIPKGIEKAGYPQSRNHKMGRGLLWSLMSESYGGFLDPAEVWNVRRVTTEIYSGTVIRNFSGEYKEDTDYEFFKEQFIPFKEDLKLWELPNCKFLMNKFYRGDRVKVYARQIWGEKLDSPINGTVYQNQGDGRSVIVSVDPRLLKSPSIDPVGGTTLEVYPQQLRYHSHDEKHPIQGSRETGWNGSGFRLAKQYRTSSRRFF